jgi:hypothetical protein
MECDKIACTLLITPSSFDMSMKIGLTMGDLDALGENVLLLLLLVLGPIILSDITLS